MIYAVPGHHPAATAIVLAVVLGGWAGMLVNRQYAKGVVWLVLSFAISFATCFFGLIPMWIIGIIDVSIVANRLNRGEVIGDWRFF